MTNYRFQDTISNTHFFWENVNVFSLIICISSQCFELAVTLPAGVLYQTREKHATLLVFSLESTPKLEPDQKCSVSAHPSSQALKAQPSLMDLTHHVLHVTDLEAFNPLRRHSTATRENAIEHILCITYNSTYIIYMYIISTYKFIKLIKWKKRKDQWQLLRVISWTHSGFQRNFLKKWWLVNSSHFLFYKVMYTSY